MSFRCVALSDLTQIEALDEANPRASRTVPFVAKATGVPLVKIAARVMVGATLAELRDEGLLRPPAPGGYVAVKALARAGAKEGDTVHIGRLTFEYEHDT